MRKTIAVVSLAIAGFLAAAPSWAALLENPGGGGTNFTQNRERSDMEVKIIWDFLVKHSETIRNLVLIVGTPVAIILAVWRSRVAAKQAEIAQRGLLADRYQRAVEMTGHELASIRIGGIFSLQDLALEHHDEYRSKVLNFLSAYGLGAGGVVKFKPVGKDGKPVSGYKGEPTDEWLAKETIGDIKRISQEKSAARWWKK